MIHGLSQCRQAACTDAATEARRRQFLDALNRVTEMQPVNRIRWALTTSTATSSTTTWRTEP